MTSVTATAPKPAPVKIERHVWVISGVVILGMIMSILDTTIVNVALDTLSKELHSPISQVQWVVTGYLLALAAVMPVTGWMARRFGAKRVYLVSLLLFTLGSIACGFSNTLVALVVFRVLQGIGGGMIMPLAQLIMAQVAGPQRMGRVMGIVSMPAMLAPILGPVVGGVILQNLHWSWIFFVNAPIGVIAMYLGWRMLPETDSGEAGPLDKLGLALLPAGAALSIFGISKLGSGGSLELARSARAADRRSSPERRVLPARAANPAPPARRQAVQEQSLRGRLVHDLRPRRRAFRRDDPRARSTTRASAT